MKMPKRNHNENTNDEGSVCGDDTSSVSSQPQTRKRRKYVSSPLDHCQEIYDRLRYFKKEEGKSLCEAFIRLPNRRAAAEYYEVVKTPIDLIKIQNKIKSEEYNDLQQFQQDIELLVSNAKTFHKPGSQEYNDACEVLELFFAEKAAIENSANGSGSETSSLSRPRRGGRRDEKEDDESDHMSVTASETSEIGLDSLLEHLFANIVTTSTEDGRSWTEAFTILPSKQIYPQYYDIIKDPIDLRMIAQKIQNSQYSSIDELEKDFVLLTKNARSFNEPKSPIYQDAVFVAKIVKTKRNELEQLRTCKTSERIRSKKTVDCREILENFACIEVLPDKEGEEEEEEEEDELEDDELEEEDEGVEGSCGEETQEIDYNPNDPRYVYMQIFNFIIHYKNSHGQTISDPFLKLPSKKQYPDYYVEIKNPLSLFNIKAKIKRNHYKSLDALANDFDVVFNNAQQYNIEESKIHRDAVKLQKFMRIKKEEFQRLQGQSRRCATAAASTTAGASYAAASKPVALGASGGGVSSVGGFLAALPMSSGACAIPVPAAPRSAAGEAPAVLAPLLNLAANAAGPSGVPPPPLPPPPALTNENQGDPQAYLGPGPRANTVGVPGMNDTTLSGLMGGVRGAMPAGPEVGHVPGHSPVVSALSDALRKRAATGRRPPPPEEIRKKRVHALYHVVFNHEEGGRFLREIFMVLPSKEDYPDYYQVIPEPIDLTTIKKKIDEDSYQNHHDLVADLRLMFNNARHYNEENSQVYRDAETLEKVLKRKLKNLGSLTGVPRQVKRKPLVNARGMPGTYTCSPAPLQRRLQELFLTIRDYRDTSGRLLATPFMRLPSRADLPQYYEFIKKPIELEAICTKIGSGKYVSLEELVMDLVLMFDNACKFNEPDSPIYRDALTLMRVCMGKRAALLATASPEEQEDRIPDVQAAVQDIMTGILTHLYYFRDDDGRQLTDSFAELADQYRQRRQGKAGDEVSPLGDLSQEVKAADGKEEAEGEALPLVLDHVKANMEARRYRRLDRFQDDILQVFRSVRKISRPDSQAFEDSCTLHRVYLAIRDQLCRRGEVLQSPALTQTELHLEQELATYARKELPDPAPAKGSAELVRIEAEVKTEGESGRRPDGLPAEACKTIIRDGEIYGANDFVYIKPQKEGVREPHIGCLEEIRIVDNEPKVYVNWFYRPAETTHVPTRKFMEQEVFKSDSHELLNPDQIAGRCHVMYVKEYIKQKPANLEEKDIYVCESRYSSKHRAFKKIKIWPLKTSPRIQLVDRESICLPARIPSMFVPSLQPTEDAQRAIKAAPPTPSVANLPALEKRKEIVVSDDRSAAESVIYYEQFVYDNGFWVKVGDFVYVPSIDGQGRHIVRIDRMWKNTQQNVLYFSGPWFVAPLEIEHLPTRVFYSKEVFLSSVDHASHLLSSILGKCVVLALTDYVTYRPTEYQEEDLYLCESKYFVDEKAIRRLKKGLKKFQLSEGSLEDEIYYFRKQINPKKEASPLLYQASQEPLCYDLIRHPHQGAGTALLSGDDDTRDSFTSGTGGFDEGSMHGTPSNNAVVLERGGKKRKLRKAPSGYVVFAGEVRKDLLRQRPEAAFGEISKEVGLMWRNLAQSEKDRFERKAQEIKRAMEEEEAARAAQEQQAAAASMPPPGLHQPSPAPSPAQLGGAIGGIAVGSPVRVSTPMNATMVPGQNLQSTVFSQQQQQSMVQLLQPTSNAHGGVMAAPLVQQQAGTQQLVYQLPPNAAVTNGHAGGQQFVQMATRPPNSVVPGSQAAGQQLVQGTGTNGIHSRPPSPTFVSCPPRTTRVMHSEIYQKYIERVRRNADYLSDWPRQLTASAENSAPLSIPASAKLHQIGTTFLSKMPTKQEEIGAALWAMRDHLLRDALNIQMRELPLDEL